MASLRGGEEIVDEVDEMIYVAVGKEIKPSKLIIDWAIRNAKGKRLCLVHVHQPAQYICILGGRFPISSLSEQEVMIHQEKERQDMRRILDEYVRFCTKARVQVEKLYVEKESIESGLVELIIKHQIEKLVMGAAADKKYSRKMIEPKSKKANYIRNRAPAYCHIWFTCKGNLVYTRESIKQSHLNDKDLSRQECSMSRLYRFSSHLSASTSIDSGGSCDDLNRSSIFSISQLSMFSRSSDPSSDSTLYYSGAEDTEPSSQSLVLPPKSEGKKHYLASPNMLEGTMDASLYYELDQALTEAEIAKQQAFEESIMRHQAEKDAFEAIHKANTVESLYNEELRRREKLEDELIKAKEIIERTKEERDIAVDELRVAVDQNLLLKSRVEKSDIMGKELEEKLVSAWELFQMFRKL